MLEFVKGCYNLADILQDQHPCPICALEVLEHVVNKIRQRLSFACLRNVLLIFALCIAESRAEPCKLELARANYYD